MFFCLFLRLRQYEVPVSPLSHLIVIMMIPVHYSDGPSVLTDTPNSGFIESMEDMPEGHDGLGYSQDFNWPEGLGEISINPIVPHAVADSDSGSDLGSSPWTVRQRVILAPPTISDNASSLWMSTSPMGNSITTLQLKAFVRAVIQCHMGISMRGWNPQQVSIILPTSHLLGAIVHVEEMQMTTHMSEEKFEQAILVSASTGFVKKVTLAQERKVVFKMTKQHRVRSWWTKYKGNYTSLHRNNQWTYQQVGKDMDDDSQDDNGRPDRPDAGSDVPRTWYVQLQAESVQFHAYAYDQAKKLVLESMLTYFFGGSNCKHILHKARSNSFFPE
ncbi:hypothetical protein BU15DRAFT_63722 [Melanogaster broomeanus]|nr:hypothetical protein BU15DRAFT_63722 [Melanogaster broomeanus]